MSILCLLFVKLYHDSEKKDITNKTKRWKFTFLYSKTFQYTSLFTFLRLSVPGLTHVCGFRSKS